MPRVTLGRAFILTALVAGTALVGLAANGGMPAAAKGDPVRGAYLAQIMDCGGCHTPGVFTGNPDMTAYLGGGDVGFQIPGLGVFFPPNLTPDAETGLGSWQESQIADAVRAGKRPDGRELSPAMPWRAYAALNDADAADLAAYLKSLPPRRYQVAGPFGPSEAVPAPYFTIVAPAIVAPAASVPVSQ